MKAEEEESSQPIKPKMSLQECKDFLTQRLNLSAIQANTMYSDYINACQEFAMDYARIQIEKDREEAKRLMNEKLKDFEGLNPEIEEIIDRPITLD